MEIADGPVKVGPPIAVATIDGLGAHWNYTREVRDSLSRMRVLQSSQSFWFSTEAVGLAVGLHSDCDLPGRSCFYLKPLLRKSNNPPMKNADPKVVQDYTAYCATCDVTYIAEDPYRRCPVCGMEMHPQPERSSSENTPD